MLVAGTVGNRLAGLGIAVGVVEPLCGIVVQQTEHGVVLGNVAGVAFAGLLGVDVAGQSDHASVVSGDVVRQIGVDLQRRRGGADAVHVHVAAHGLTGNVVGGLVLGGTELAVAGDVNDGQSLVVLPKNGVGQAALCIGTGTAGFDPNVSPLDALEEELLSLGLGDVDGDGVLVSVALGPCGGAAGLAGDVGGLGLEDLCAHLSHQAASEGAGNVGTGDEHFDALENAKLGILVPALGKLVVDLFEHYEYSFLLVF